MLRAKNLAQQFRCSINHSSLPIEIRQGSNKGSHLYYRSQTIHTARNCSRSRHRVQRTNTCGLVGIFGIRTIFTNRTNAGQLAVFQGKLAGGAHNTAILNSGDICGNRLGNLWQFKAELSKFLRRQCHFFLTISSELGGVEFPHPPA